MQSVTNPQGKGLQTPTSVNTVGGESRRNTQKRRRIEVALWFVGMLVFIVTCVIMHFHPRPYAIDLSSTHAVQDMHLPAWLIFILSIPSIINNPFPGEEILIALVAGFLLIGLIRHLRKLPSLTWFMSGIFLAVTVASSAGLNALLDIIVGRPRPDPRIDHIHLYTPLVPYPTYPSGHAEHDVVFYGCLLYLSLNKAVREWKYYWIVVIFQIYAVFDLLDIGYSRIYDGDHWLTDVLGGYLEGALYLFFFIFLYRWATDWIVRRRQKKMDEKKAIAG